MVLPTGLSFTKRRVSLVFGDVLTAKQYWYLKPLPLELWHNRHSMFLIFRDAERGTRRLNLDLHLYNNTENSPDILVYCNIHRDTVRGHYFKIRFTNKSPIYLFASLCFSFIQQRVVNDSWGNINKQAAVKHQYKLTQKESYPTFM